MTAVSHSPLISFFRLSPVTMIGNGHAWQSTGSWTSNTGCFVAPGDATSAFYGGAESPAPPPLPPGGLDNFGSDTCFEPFGEQGIRTAMQRQRALAVGEPSVGSLGTRTIPLCSLICKQLRLEFSVLPHRRCASAQCRY